MYFLVLIFLTVTSSVLGVDRSLYKTCNQSEFCSVLRNVTEFPVLENDPLTIVVYDSGFSMNFVNQDTQEVLVANISAVEGNIFRIKVEEANSSRYDIPFVLNDIEYAEATVDRNEQAQAINVTFGKNTALVTLSGVLFFQNDILVAIFNQRNKLSMNVVEESITFDIFFPNAARVYGIPEHADHLALRNTTNSTSDPYRLYNLDVAGYEPYSEMALYGSVPVLYAHAYNYTSGIYFNNAAEQWVDIEHDEAEGGISVYFMAETGALDLFILMGPDPYYAVTQYASLTGVAHIPQYWALGYHQSRWNYDNQSDVINVITNFDDHDFPIDALWLDIEYTDQKKYFTWNPENFSDPFAMQANLTNTDRKLVTIIDPHYKVDNDYFVYKNALEKDLFVKTENGSVFQGDCWPGLSSYFDFLNPEAVDYFASLYSYDNFNFTTSTLGGIWNDMNEPSVFDDTLEKTFPKGNLHYGNISHSVVHNLYGFAQTRATYHGLIQRDNGTSRPFILSRSHFAGTQKYAAVWTGDNTADWTYIALSYSMCLSEALAGISFCGADVGGFSDDPDEELLVRFYQSGAWLPFYRAHANFGTKRREPYLFSDDVQDRIRSALRLRYAHIQYWYTLFYEHYHFGTPVIRPLFFHYPKDLLVVDIDLQILVGQDIMVRPVIEPGATTASVYFPGGERELWYNIDEQLIYFGAGYTLVPVTLDAIPVYYRGGSIIPRKDIPRRNTMDLRYDPYTIYVFLDDDNQASGELYIDDYESFEYQQENFVYWFSTYYDGVVISVPIGGNFSADNLVIDSYVIYRRPRLTRDIDGPVKYERTVITETYGGVPLRDIKFDASTQKSIRLF